MDDGYRFRWQLRSSLSKLGLAGDCLSKLEIRSGQESHYRPRRGQWPARVSSVLGEALNPPASGVPHQERLLPRCSRARTSRRSTVQLLPPTTRRFGRVAFQALTQRSVLSEVKNRGAPKRSLVRLSCRSPAPTLWRGVSAYRSNPVGKWLSRKLAFLLKPIRACRQRSREAVRHANCHLVPQIASDI